MTLSNSSIGWLITNNGSSTFWEIPEGDGFYACSNDDAANDDGSADYLITPEMHFIGLSDIQLSFLSFFNGEYGETGTIEISFDNGNSWSVVEEMEANDEWTEIQVDLSEFSGETSCRIAFHANDNGEWGSGWAVDNVSITDSKNAEKSSTVVGTHIYLDNELIAFVPEPDTFYIIQDYSFYGYHDICVDKVYTNDEGNHTWNSCYGTLCVLDIGTDWPCMPPQNLGAEEGYDYEFIYTIWNTPDEAFEPGNELIGYNIYRDGEIINNTPYNDTIYLHYTSQGFYCYEITALYPNCESDPSNEACVDFWDWIVEVESNLKILPNPAQTFCKIESTENISRIKVLSQMGQTLKSIKNINSNEYQIDVSNLDNGMYIFEIKSHNKTQKSKVVIRR